MHVRKNSRLLVFSALAGALLFLGQATAGELTEKFDKTFHLQQGGRFTLQNANGAIHVATWDREEVRVEAEKRVHGGSREVAERLLRETEILVEATGAEVRVDTRTPHSEGHGFWSWLFDGGGGDIEVIYWITLPKRTTTQLASTNGMVEVRDVVGSCDVRTTNGRIVVEDIAGGLRAETTNGSIELRLMDTQDTADLTLETTNGSITATLPASFAGWVSAKTTNGGIRSDFPVTIERRHQKNHLEGKVGEGKMRFHAKTTNGSIRLLKS